MLKFTYKLTVKERVKAKCPRHPRYNPERDGRGGIIGACTACYSLYDLLEARNKLDAAVREFVRRAGPWAVAREPRKKKPQPSAEPTALQPEEGRALTDVTNTRDGLPLAQLKDDRRMV